MILSSQWNNDRELSGRLITLFNLNYNVQIEKNAKVDIGDAKVDIGDEKVDIGLVETCISNIIVNLPTKEKIKTQDVDIIIYKPEWYWELHREW